MGTFLLGLRFSPVMGHCSHSLRNTPAFSIQIFSISQVERPVLVAPRRGLGTKESWVTKREVRSRKGGGEARARVCR